MTYQRPVSVFWWTSRRSFVIFVLRELSSVFVAWFVVFLLLMIRAVGVGPTAYQEFVAWAGSPWVVGLNLVALAFVVLHTVTWFALTPQALPVRLRGRRIPTPMIIPSQYAGLIVVSAVIVWLVLI